MSTNTKEHIFRSFIIILSEKPFDKITVRDIVEKANINRNTFYYYYSDIYELLEELFSIEEKSMVDSHSKGFRWFISFSKIIESAYRNKKIIHNICASRSYEYLETYMFKSCNRILTEYVMEIAEGKNIPDHTVDFIISFYEYAISGTLTNWYRTGMKEKPEEILQEFMYMFEGLVGTIDNIAKKNDNENTV